MFPARGRARLLAAACFGLMATGCAVSPTADLDAFAADQTANSFELFDRSVDTETTLVLPLVQDPQTSGPSCGAHALASVVNYWNGPAALDGEALYRERPPENASGYSMSELMDIAGDNGLLASAVRLSETDLIEELERGRPVLAPVRLPSVYVQQRTLPGARTPVVSFARHTLIQRTARASEWSRFLMVDHYLLLAGYDGDTFVVVEPVMGFRTIKAETLARYRAPFRDAAIVFSAPGETDRGGMQAAERVQEPATEG